MSRRNKCKQLVVKVFRNGLVNSAHDCAEGGIAIALAESCIGGKLGCEVSLPVGDLRRDTALFGEMASAIVVSVSAENQSAWESYLEANLQGNYQQLGVVNGDSLVIGDLVNVSVSDMTDNWANAIERRL